MEVPGRVDRDTPVTSTDIQLFCTPCKEDDRQEHAEGYCEVCQEYLCKTCISHHRKFKMSKSHRILQGRDMPTHLYNEDSLDTSCSEVCDQHSGEVIKYYCTNHDVVGCGPCTTINHRTCKIDFIPDLAKRYKDSNEYKSLLSTISEIQTLLNDLKHIVKKQQKEVEDIHAVAIQDIRRYRQEINKYLDQEETKLIEKAEQLKDENMKALRDIEDRRVNMQKEFLQIDELFQDHANEVSKLFIAAKRRKKTLGKLQTDCLHWTKASNLKQYKFRLDKTMQEIASMACGSYGDVVHINTKSPVLTRHVNMLSTDRSVSDLKFRAHGKITVVHSNDTYKYEPWVTGLCILSPDTLLTADSNNKALKLVDISSRKIKSTLGLTFKPWDVTCLPDDQVAVTIPYEKIQIVSTRGGLSRVREIKVSGECYGICYSDCKLLVTYRNSDKLEIMNMDGTVYQTVTTIKINNVLSKPSHITLSNTYTGKYIYVSDYSTNTVTKLTMEGEIVSQFQDQRLSSPLGLVAIGDNHLAVCCSGGHKIIVIRDENEKMEIAKQWDCVGGPQAIEFSPQDNTLYVSSGGYDGCKDIYLYKLSF